MPAVTRHWRRIARVFLLLAPALLLSAAFVPVTLPWDFVGLASGIQNQRDPTACEAVDLNWTNCEGGFASDDVYAFANGTAGAPQFARPDADHDTDSWTTSPLWSKVDEGSPGDDTRIQSPGDPSDDTTDDVIFTLSDVSDPGVSTDHVIRVEWHEEQTAGVPATVTGRVRLYLGDPNAGGTLIATLQATVDGATDVTDTYTLTAGEADSITDYSDLYLRVTGEGAIAGPESITLFVDMVEFEVPSAGASDTIWHGFGFSLNASDTIETVEVGVEWFRENTDPILNVTLSWDGGVSWATNQTATNKSVDDDTLEWLNFTSVTSWTASKLSDANFRVRLGTNASGGRLDYVSVRVNFDRAPSVSNFRLEDGAATSMAGAQLDVDTTYYLLFNVTDEDGWSDIGDDGNVSLRLWYDGNASPELTFAEQTTGANYRIELRYVDTGDPATATLGEWSIVEGSATYNASASSLTAITSGSTTIGYEFKLAFELGFQAKHAVDPTDAATGSYNDADSWNAEVVATDGTSTTTLQAATAGEHMEFGIFQYVFVNISGDWTVSLGPGEAQSTNSVVVHHRSNDAFTLKVWFVTDLTKGSDTVSVTNVEILAAADPDDNITADTAFAGLGEANATFILGTSTWYFPHTAAGNEDTTTVQFRVTIPLGTAPGTYTATLTIKIEQQPP